MRIAIVTGSILLALASHASAQPGMPAPAPGPALDPPRAPAQGGQPQSETMALALSAGGTIASWGVVLAATQVESSDLAGGIAAAGGVGAVILPSLGHWYSGTYFTRGMGLRLAGGATFMVAGYLWLTAENDNSPDSSGGSPWLGAIAIVGAAAIVGGTIDDLITAPIRVRRRNEERGLAISPIVTRHTTGLAFGGRF